MDPNTNNDNKSPISSSFTTDTNIFVQSRKLLKQINLLN